MGSLVAREKDCSIAEVGKNQVSLSSLTTLYRVTLEESFAHERPEVRNPDKHWYEIIPCQGFRPGPPQEGPYIGLFSEAPPTLHLFTNRVGNARSILEEIKDCPGVRADFMDGEVILCFPATPELLHKVAVMAGARKRRQLSAEHRAKLVEAGKVGREALKKWQKERTQTQKSTQFEAPGL